MSFRLFGSSSKKAGSHSLSRSNDTNDDRKSSAKNKVPVPRSPSQDNSRQDKIAGDGGLQQRRNVNYMSIDTRLSSGGSTVFSGLEGITEGNEGEEQSTVTGAAASPTPRSQSAPVATPSTGAARTPKSPASSRAMQRTPSNKQQPTPTSAPSTRAPPVAGPRFLIQGALLKLKRGVAGSTWKRNWIYADTKQVLHYSSSRRPKPGDEPKNTLLLEQCDVEQSFERKMCFKITDRSSMTTLVLAVDDIEGYQAWMRALSYDRQRLLAETSQKSALAHLKEQQKNTDSPPKPASETADSASSGQQKPRSEDGAPESVFERTKDEVISTFFGENNVMQDFAHPCVRFHQLSPLFKQLDASLNPTIATALLAVDLGHHISSEADGSLPSSRMDEDGIEGIVSESDFADWWEHNSAYLEPVSINAQTILQKSLDPDVGNVLYSTPSRISMKASRTLQQLTSVDAHEMDELKTEAHFNLNLATASILPNITSPPRPDDNHQHSAMALHHHLAAVGLEDKNTIHFAGFLSSPAESALKMRSSYLVRMQLPTSKFLTGRFAVPFQPFKASQTVTISAGDNATINTPFAASSVHTSAADTIDEAFGAINQATTNSSFGIDNFPIACKDINNITDIELAPMPVDWNLQYQHLYTTARDASDNVVPVPVKPRSVSEDNEEHEAKQISNSISEQLLRMISAVDVSLQLCRFRAKFYRAAMAGVRQLVNEYCFPDEMKSLRRISASPSLASAEHDVGNSLASVGEVFTKWGLIFNIIGAPAVEEDRIDLQDEDRHLTAASIDEDDEESQKRSHLVVAQDVVLHKSCGCEYRNTETLQRCLAALSTQQHVMHSWDAMRAKAVADVAAAAADDCGVTINDSASQQETRKSQVSGKSAPSSKLTIPGTGLNKFTNFKDVTLRRTPRAHDAKNRNTSTEPASNKPATSAARLPTADTSEFTTTFSTIVDFAGFRVSVVCPVPLHQQETLVYGSLSLPGDDVSSDVEWQESLARSVMPKLFTGELDATIEEALSLMHVSIAPKVTSIVPQLASQLNLALSMPQQRPVLRASVEDVLHPKKALQHTETAQLESVVLLNNDLQVHRYQPQHQPVKGRVTEYFYFMQLHSLMPSDLPRGESFDVRTRQMRPEFLLRRGTQSALYSDSMQSLHPLTMSSSSRAAAATTESATEDRDQLDISLDDFEGSSFIYGNQPELRQGVTQIEGISALYKRCLPRVAALLDHCTEIPIDSFGFTNFLHYHGVNCRHLGALYAICRSPWVRQLILSECIGRSFKVAMSSMLRSSARNARAEVLCAQQRGRSGAPDFIEFHENEISRRTNIVVQAFNLALGFGNKSNDFWNGAMRELLREKFGIFTSRIHINGHVHWPQVFYAMQYHTNTRFLDENYNDKLHNASTSLPFSASDIVLVEHPQVKMQMQIPGELGCFISSGDALLTNGMPKEASIAYGMQHLVHSHTIYACFGNNSIKIPLKQLLPMAHVLYKLALSYYSMGQIQEAVRVLYYYLQRFPRHHPVGGRVLTLLMCIEFRYFERLDKAKSLFDAGQEVYTYALGANHPIINLHMSCMADLYMLHPEMLPQSLVMRTLSYAAAKKSLGDAHVITALYELKLASLHLKQNSDHLHETQQMLSNVIAVLERKGRSESTAVSTVSYFDYEVMLCLHQLSVCYAKLDDNTRAIACAFRCLEYASRLKSLRQSLIVMISCYLLLSDVYNHLNEAYSAQEMLEEAWMKLKLAPQQSALVMSQNDECGGQQTWMGKMMAALSHRIIEIYLRALPYPKMSLLESMAADWVEKIEEEALSEQKRLFETTKVLVQEYDISEIEDDTEACTHLKGKIAETLAAAVGAANHIQMQWEKAYHIVSEAMWRLQPAEYCSIIMEGLQQESAIADNASSDVRKRKTFARQPDADTKRTSMTKVSSLSLTMGAGGKDSEIYSIPFAAQGAVLLKIVNMKVDAFESSFNVLRI